LEEKERMIAKWAQEDVETLDNLLNNNNYIYICIYIYIWIPLGMNMQFTFIFKFAKI